MGKIMLLEKTDAIFALLRAVSTNIKKALGK